MDENMEELDNIIVLNNENGEEVKFEMTESDEEDEGEVVILKVEDTDEDSDEESYVSVEDEEVLMKVFNIFKEKFKDEFNFVDED